MGPADARRSLCRASQGGTRLAPNMSHPRCYAPPMTLDLGQHRYVVVSISPGAHGRLILTLDREPISPPGPRQFDCMAILRDGRAMEPVRISGPPDSRQLTCTTIY